jgi:hypothetical protein
MREVSRDSTKVSIQLFSDKLFTLLSDSESISILVIILKKMLTMELT